MICVHGSLDPVKDASPVSTRDDESLVLGACACLVRPQTSFPSLGHSRGHPMSPVRPPTREELLSTRRTDLSSSFRRYPAKGAAILKNGMPFTVVTSA
jgi:hypothetical protein